MYIQNLIYVGIAVFVLLIIILVKRTGGSKSISLDNVSESYFYRYGGDIPWIKNKLETYRFKALSSMLSCKNAEESDFRIDIIDDDNIRKMNVYATEFSYDNNKGMEPIISDLPLTDEQYEFFLSSVRLKATYAIAGDKELEIDNGQDFVE